MQISNCGNAESVRSLRSARNRTLKEIRKKTKANRETFLDQIAGDIDKMQDHTKIFKAAKSFKRKNFENPYVTDEQNKRLTNPTAMYNAIKMHFNNHFYDTNIQALEPSVGEI